MSSEQPCARCGGKSIIRSVASYQDVRGGEIVDTRGEVRSRACPDCLLDTELAREAFDVAADALSYLETAYRKIGIRPEDLPAALRNATSRHCPATLVRLAEVRARDLEGHAMQRFRKVRKAAQ